MDIQKVQLDEILGQEEVKKQLKSAVIAKRNVIIVGPPGVGKTTIAKGIAKALPENIFIRVQGSPDLSAEDLIGDIDPAKALEFGPQSKEAFSPGKLFKADGGVLFFDEVNRCSEKLQNALLQALEEKRVTIGSYDVDVPTNFLFIGTMNPEDSSTEKLSDVFLDRFDLVEMGYPETEEVERKIIERRGQDMIRVPDSIRNAITGFIARLREDERLEKKPSVRASLGLYDRSQAHAKLLNKKEVDFEDLSSVIVSVLAHRIGLKASVKYLQSAEEYVQREFQRYARESDVSSDGP